MITQKDIKKLKTIFPTKEDLKNELRAYATKDDLKNELRPYATKDYLRTMMKENTDIIVGEIRKIIDMIGHNIEEMRKTQSGNKEIFDDHEKRINLLEQKTILA